MAVKHTTNWFWQETWHSPSLVLASLLNDHYQPTTVTSNMIQWWLIKHAMEFNIYWRQGEEGGQCVHKSHRAFWNQEEKREEGFGRRQTRRCHTQLMLLEEGGSEDCVNLHVMSLISLGSRNVLVWFGGEFRGRSSQVPAHLKLLTGSAERDRAMFSEELEQPQPTIRKSNYSATS